MQWDPYIAAVVRARPVGCGGFTDCRRTTAAPTGRPTHTRTGFDPATTTNVRLRYLTYHAVGHLLARGDAVGSALPEPRAAIARSGIALDRAVGHITRYGLARTSGDGPILHPITLLKIGRWNWRCSTAAQGERGGGRDCCSADVGVANAM
ncbi:hypothetical protein AB0J14_34740 [Micromonospora arborensis]|uniref:hypothetical protein n=1 Tax=Micromonospora arborensis TaxID=2116518 RepID=UPI0033D27EDA